MDRNPLRTKLAAALMAMLSLKYLIVFLNSDYFASLNLGWQTLGITEVSIENQNRLDYGLAFLALIALFYLWRALLTRFFSMGVPV